MEVHFTIFSNFYALKYKLKACLSTEAFYSYACSRHLPVESYTASFKVCTKLEVRRAGKHMTEGEERKRPEDLPNEGRKKV